MQHPSFTSFFAYTHIKINRTRTRANKPRSFLDQSDTCSFQVKLLSKDYGKHLLEVEDMLQKQSLQEADIAIQADRVQTLNTSALKFTTIEGECAVLEE